MNLIHEIQSPAEVLELILGGINSRLDIWNTGAKQSGLISILKELSDHGKQIPSGVGKVKRR